MLQLEEFSLFSIVYRHSWFEAYTPEFLIIKSSNSLHASCI